MKKAEGKAKVNHPAQAQAALGPGGGAAKGEYMTRAHVKGVLDSILTDLGISQGDAGSVNLLEVLEGMATQAARVPKSKDRVWSRFQGLFNQLYAAGGLKE